jgi:ribonuclease-3
MTKNQDHMPGDSAPLLHAQHTSALADMLGVSFHNLDLLGSALIHRSFLNEHPERTEGLPSNERLEFLGDAVLNLVTASWLYQTFPERSEGELTALRAALVKTPTLARFARMLNLGEHVRISRGEASNAARERPALLADVFEAVLGAIYLDQGVDAATRFVQPFLQQETDLIIAGQSDIDHRSRLQEHIQARQGITPTYRTVQISGPDHRRNFTIEVLVGEERLGVGSGASKQVAAQNAARQALEALHAQDGSRGDDTSPG